MKKKKSINSFKPFQTLKINKIIGGVTAFGIEKEKKSVGYSVTAQGIQRDSRTLGYGLSF